MIAHVEWGWIERIRRQVLFRYELPTESFLPTSDEWMWVSKESVKTTSVERIDDLLAALHAQGVELRVMESLLPLRAVWRTTLHASGIRLRYAQGWQPAHVCDHAAERPSCNGLLITSLVSGRLVFMSESEIDEYLSSLEDPKRSTLEQLRRTILEVVPDAEQGISYGVPAFRLRGKVVAGFAAFKNHLSYLPHSGSVFPELRDELTAYRTSTGALQFPIDSPLPRSLVEHLVDIRIAQAFSEQTSLSDGPT